MVAVVILFSLFALLLLLGMIGDRDATNRKNFTYAFCAVVLLIAIMILKFV